MEDAAYSLETVHKILEDASYQMIRLSSVPKIIDQYVEYAIVGDRDEHVFETFCELKGLELMRRLVKNYPEEILNGMSFLLVNINRQACLSYILSHPVMAQLVSRSNTQKLDEYVSMLKTLSSRMDASRIFMLFNQKHCRFPLAWESARFFNHPQTLVRASTTNTILALMKISQATLRQYFSSFPFNMYYVHVCCGLFQKIKDADQQLAKGNAKNVITMLEDEKDTPLLMLDMLQLNILHVNQIIKNSILVFLLKPILSAFSSNQKGQFSINLSLYLLLQYSTTFRFLNDILEFMCQAVFGVTISSKLLQQLNKPVSLPRTFNKTFKHDSYLETFPNDIDNYCKKIFKKNDEKIKISETLQSQLYKLSMHLGIDVLTGERIRGFWFDTWKQQSQQRPNPIRSTILSFLKTKDDKMLQLTTKLILLFMNSKTIDKNILVKCGLSLQQSTEFNRQSINSLSETYLNLTLSELPFSQKTLNSVFIILNKILSKNTLRTIEKQLILKSFSKSCQELRKNLKSRLGNQIIQQIEETFDYPVEDRHTPPDLLVAESDFVQQNLVRQQLITFNCLRKLRYDLIKETKMKQPNLQLLYVDKFYTESEVWAVGNTVLMGSRPIFQCFSKSLNLPIMIVRDSQRLILAKQVEQQNKVYILINYKLKNITIDVLDNNTIKIYYQRRNIAELQFENEYLMTTAVQRIEADTLAIIGQQLKFFNSYINECLSDLP